MKIIFRQNNFWRIISTPGISLTIEREVRLNRMRFVGLTFTLHFFSWYAEASFFNKTHELPRYRGR